MRGLGINGPKCQNSILKPLKTLRKIAIMSLQCTCCSCCRLILTSSTQTLTLVYSFSPLSTQPYSICSKYSLWLRLSRMLFSQLPRSYLFSIIRQVRREGYTGWWQSEGSVSSGLNSGGRACRVRMQASWELFWDEVTPMGYYFYICPQVFQVGMLGGMIYDRTNSFGFCYYTTIVECCDIISRHRLMQPEPVAQVYSREQYASKQFWDARYKEKPSYFDWYAEFPELKDTFEQQYGLQHGMSILMLGCGNSKLSQQMYEAGYHNILNIDISPAVIDQMKEISQTRGYTGMRWEVMDATHMPQISDHSFDVIIDKGTLDALVSGKNMDICEKMLRESMRVLKKTGQFILITYGSPEGRKKLFESSIGLNRFEYWFTKVDLSSMSTLINLMRANLGNQPLSAITKDAQAMSKSLVEFNLLKVLRRHKKNEKKYIVWTDFKQTQVTSHQQQLKASQVQAKSQGNAQQSQPQTQQAKKQVVYNPKKQSICYVYSIQHKFAIDLDEIVSDSLQGSTSVDERGNTVLQTKQAKSSIGIFVQGGHEQEMKKVIAFLSRQKPLYNRIVIYNSPENLHTGQQQHKYTIRSGSRNTLPAYAKTVYQVTIPINTNLAAIQKQLATICYKIQDNAGLQVHPSPRNYGYLGILMQKTGYTWGFGEYLKTRWYPTYRLISFQKAAAVYEISVPPTLTEQYCREQIVQVLRINKNNVVQMRVGYVNYFQPRLIGLLNLCSMTYSQGESAYLISEQWQENTAEFFSQAPTIFLKKQALPYALVRILTEL